MTIPKDNSQLENACKTLSVTFGDSSPKGRAKGALQLCHMSQQHKETERICTDALR